MASSENPFAFGHYVEGDFFTDRTEDAKRLLSNLTHGINTILISPRRWGKSSLVRKVIASSKYTHPDVRFVMVDIFACKSEYEFYKMLASAVMKQTSSKIDELVELGKRFLSNISPKFSFGSDPMTDFSVSFEWSPKDGTEEEILQLPEKIAKEKGIRIVVCIDEFQQIMEFQDPLTFQKKLRTVWQQHQQTTYCLYGSKRHMMLKMFHDTNCPFYRFGELMFLQKISRKDWISFICHRFEITGKHITENQAEQIYELTEGISTYVQNLSWIVWYKAESAVQNKHIEEALNDLIAQNRVFFQRDIESLTGLQKNFLVAMANGVTSGFTKQNTILKYNLVNSANIQLAKKSLSTKEFIDYDETSIQFNDPIFKLWIERNIKVISILDI